MAKKFDTSNINTSKVYAGLEKTTSGTGKQTPADPEEMAMRLETGRTQGRKGCKAPRINMAFTPANHDFIKTMSKITGMTMSDFTNFVITKYREEHPEQYKKVLEMREALEMFNTEK